MQIIKEGSYRKILKIKRFECEYCGCIFEANKKEYKEEIQYNAAYYYCKCPFCGNKTYKEISDYIADEITQKELEIFNSILQKYDDKSSVS